VAEFWNPTSCTRVVVSVRRDPGGQPGRDVGQEEAAEIRMEILGVVKQHNVITS
jgi:hypothetical protein